MMVSAHVTAHSDAYAGITWQLAIMSCRLFGIRVDSSTIGFMVTSIIPCTGSSDWYLRLLLTANCPPSIFSFRLGMSDQTLAMVIWSVPSLGSASSTYSMSSGGFGLGVLLLVPRLEILIGRCPSSSAYNVGPVRPVLTCSVLVFGWLLVIHGLRLHFFYTSCK